MLKSLFLIGALHFLNLYANDLNSSKIETFPDVSQQEELTDYYFALQEGLADNANSPVLLHNLALVEKKQQQLGWALAHIERSLYMAPLNYESRLLRAEIIDAIIEKQREPPREQVSLFTRSLDFLPGLLISLLLGISIFLFFLFLALSYKKFFIEITPHEQDKKRASVFFCFVLVFGIAYYLKMQNFNQNWVCVISEKASLHSGPHAQHRVMTKLQEGDCLKTLKVQNDWVAVEPQNGSIGWLSANDTFFARGRNLTLSSKKQ